MINTYANTSDVVTVLETKNAIISRKAATEGIVLLKNNNVLPLQKGPIALYGEGAGFTMKGGTGSGEVNTRHVVSIREGLETAGYLVKTTDWLDDYVKSLNIGKMKYVADMRKRAGVMNFKEVPYIVSHPFNNPAGRAIEDNDIAIGIDTCFYVLSRQSGENVDRKPVQGDLCMTDLEVSNIEMCTKHYKNTIVVLNVGGMVDLSPFDKLNIQAIVFFCQQGGEGGHAFADLVSGNVTPSGHLTFSWPRRYADIPFGSDFSHLNGNTKEEDYREGIYVGYRYFDSFAIEPRYEFGFGLSYTTFSMQPQVSVDGGITTVTTMVTNTGKYSGKQVVQVYVSCPAGRLDKEYQRLVGFVKTDCLKQGENQTVTVRFDVETLASYDSELSQTIIEKGKYIVRVGESSRKTKDIAYLCLENNVILSQHEAICLQKSQFEELHAECSISSNCDLPELEIDCSATKMTVHSYTDYSAKTSTNVDNVLKSLKDSEKVDLCIGSGLDVALPKRSFFMVPGACGYTTSKLERRGVPAIAFCDGPAGLRLFDKSVTKGKTVRMVRPVMAFMEVLPVVARKMMLGNPAKGKLLYQYATAFPVGMSLAQTWNTELLTEIGQAVQAEMETFGAVYWLAPGMNIYRNPLCGRNYEYYSEDPLLSGKMAAAATRGVQSKKGYSVTVKHFAANNQETDRRQVSENVSERALREIYLRGFQIALKESTPNALMTSYNKINGTYAAENYDLCTKVLRNEWGFKGLVMTDWTTEANMLDSAKCMKAGVNLMMPGIKSDYIQIRRALKDGTLQQGTVNSNASHVLHGVLESDIYQMYKRTEA
ncbi:MAG: glycoside hydrolase family 3 protein [Dysgonomonas sp.]